MVQVKKGIQKKIFISTLVVGTLSVFLVTVITYLVGKYTLKHTIGDNFKGIAVETSKKLEILIQDQIMEGGVIASLNGVISAAKFSDAQYPQTGEGLIDDRLAGQDRLWKEGVPVKSPLPDRLLNDLTNNLVTFVGKQKGYLEVLVTDKKGARISANRRTSAYYFGREQWWQAAFLGRKNYVSDIFFDPDYKSYTLTVAVPIEEGGQLLGVVRMIRSVDLLFRSVTDVQVGQTDHTMLADSAGDLLFCPVFLIKNHTLRPELIQNITRQKPGWGTTMVDVHYPGRESINGFAPVQISFDLGPESFGGKHWYIFTSQDPNETYRPINTLLKWITAGGFLSVFLLSVFAYYQSRRLVDPIHALFEGTEIIGQGNLNYALKIDTGDEIEELAKKFNRMTEQLRDSYSNLEQKVEDRTRDLKEAQKQLTEVERLAVLGTLAAGVGHELRNPLAVIKNSAYFLKTKVKDADPKIQKHLAILDREVAVSERIIEDLLSFSRASEPILRETNIDRVLTEALSAVEIADQVQVKKEIGSNLGFFPSDPEYLRQVLTNLISNAVQAMPNGGELRISAQGEDEKILITVADTGIGIPPENLSKIFEPFFTTKAKGVGLGLAVAKRLIGKLGGKIHVSSEVGKGTVFVMELKRTANQVV
jgi:signal transduction histidine kinase